MPASLRIAGSHSHVHAEAGLQPVSAQIEVVSVQQMLADGLTKVLLHQLALKALMAVAAYSIPKSRIGQVTSLVAAAASRLPTASAQFAAMGHVVVVHAGFSLWTVLWTVIAFMVVCFFFQWPGCRKTIDSILGTRDRAGGTVNLDHTVHTPATLTMPTTSQTRNSTASTAIQTPQLAQRDISTMFHEAGRTRPDPRIPSAPNSYVPHFIPSATSPLPSMGQTGSASSGEQVRNVVSAVQIRAEITRLANAHQPFLLTSADERLAIRGALVKLGARCCGKVPEDFSGSNQYWTRIKCFVCGEVFQRVPALGDLAGRRKCPGPRTCA